jgi:signal transduction histidine kinase
MHLPLVEIANQAIYLAACGVTGQPPQTGSWQVELPATLVVRESCGAVPPLYPGEPEALTTTQRLGRKELAQNLHQLVETTAAMREMVSTASHDLRSPLVSIIGFADSIQSHYGNLLDERVRDRIERIRLNAEHMDGMISKLLNVSVSYSQPLNREKIHVRNIVSAVLRDLDQRLTHTNVHVVLPEELPTIFADGVALRQLFTNLIANAIKYMGKQPHPEIRIGYTESPEAHEFSVQDNGSGISPEHHGTIFQLFRRGPNVESEGYGIGLATARTIVLRHGGRIWVESREGEGATFKFVLPRHEEESDASHVSADA